MSKLVPRIALSDLKDRLESMPVVVVGGARQSGKTTLVRDLISKPRQFISLDDPNVLEVAQQNPLSLLSGEQPLTIDEVQKCPSLLLSIKQVVDKKRQSGQFLLTGSANLLLMQSVNESLTGRVSHMNLHPLTRLEQLGIPNVSKWSQLLETSTTNWEQVVNAGVYKPQSDLLTIMQKGGLPQPALSNQTKQQRHNWFADYCQTYIERDLRDLSGITQTINLRRLMKLMAIRVGQILNQAGISRQLAIAQTTINRYINLLEASYWITKLPAYRSNYGQRLIKAPKIYYNDVGLAWYLSGTTTISGQYLENLIFNDLKTWSEVRNRVVEPTNIYYWHTTSSREIDFIIEAGDKILPIEVKLSDKPQFSDCRHIMAFQDQFASKVQAGLLLHTGDLTDWISPTVLATPWWKVF